MTRQCICRLYQSHGDINDAPQSHYCSTVTVCGRRIVAILDAGATSSYISDSFNDVLRKHRLQPYGAKRQVQMADQRLRPCSHLYVITVEFNRKLNPLTVAVIPTLAENMILGMDFLNHRNVTFYIDYEGLTRP